jgi:uncharacterized protein YdcH (DUF465 family)
MESVITEEQLKAHLMSTDDHFRHLVERHHELDGQVAELESKAFLTEEEQLEEARLKIFKLRMKDEIQAIMNRH